MKERQEIARDEHFYQRLYSNLMASIPSTVLIVNKQLRVISANKNFYHKSKRTESDTLGKPLTDMFSEVILNHTHMVQSVKEVFDNGESIDGGEFEYRSSGIPTRVYYLRLTPLQDATGQVLNVIVLMDDVTESKRLGERVKRTEEHLARVVASANDIIISTDPEGKVLTWNKTIENLTGLHTEDVKGKSFASLFQKEHQAEVQAAFQKLAAEKRVPEQELSIFDKEENLMEISWNFSAMKGERDTIIGFVIIGRDLTERKILRRRLIHSAKMVSLGIMAGGIAHEVRNPLAIINSCAQILENESENQQIHDQSIQKIKKATKRASTIVNNLLKFARQSEISMTNLNMNSVINSTLAVVDNQLSLAHLTVDTQYHEHLSPIVGDMTQLQQVCMNIILNACAAVEGQGVLRIETYQENDMVHVRFTDNGEGISPQDLAHIFDPFFTTKQVGEGVGLGLSISYGIVKQHNGDIYVESEPGTGTEFIIQLPAREGNLERNGE